MVADAMPLQRMRDGLEELTHPSRPYAAAARAQLRGMDLGTYTRNQSPSRNLQ